MLGVDRVLGSHTARPTPKSQTWYSKNWRSTMTLGRCWWMRRASFDSTNTGEGAWRASSSFPVSRRSCRSSTWSPRQRTVDIRPCTCSVSSLGSRHFKTEPVFEKQKIFLFFIILITFNFVEKAIGHAPLVWPGKKISYGLINKLENMVWTPFMKAIVARLETPLLKS